MAWQDSIDHPHSLFNMYKPERPLIDIPPPSHTHRHPLRTPEDVPLPHQHAPWWATQQLPHMDDVYPFDDPHNRFPDVEDADWAMGTVSPPSPSRRSSLELEPLPEQDPDQPSPYDDIDSDDPPTLSPPSPCRRTLAALPHGDADTETDIDSDSDWPHDSDCPQLSPPSPIHRSAALPSLDFDPHPLLIEDSQPVPLPSQLPHLTPLEARLRAEHRALHSLRDRTIHAERTSRARNQALRGCERDLGRAVAALRATPPSPSPTPSDPTPTLHAYRTAATRVMLERTEEKRRRKKDKERLKELRIVLGVGLDALLGGAEGLTHPTTGMGNAPGDEALSLGLGLALNVPAPPEEERARALAERTYAMRRLVARMTMRRRDLGMRSLIEAGNMADGDEGAKEAKRPRARSKLAVEVVAEEEDIYPWIT